MLKTATDERFAAVQPSLRDWPFAVDGTTPSAKALGYSQSSLRDVGLEFTPLRRTADALRRAGSSLRARLHHGAVSFASCRFPRKAASLTEVHRGRLLPCPANGDGLAEDPFAFSEREGKLLVERARSTCTGQASACLPTRTHRAAAFPPPAARFRLRDAALEEARESPGRFLLASFGRTAILSICVLVPPARDRVTPVLVRVRKGPRHTCTPRPALCTVRGWPVPGGALLARPLAAIRSCSFT